ncbi:MAG: hypothetical protein K5660_06345 [Paludibacteraceae bacterium]|nr:hypothetical protein [Paludibacteraceae bacterium]
MGVAQVIEKDNQITIITDKGNVATGSYTGGECARADCMEETTKRALDKD